MDIDITGLITGLVAEAAERFSLLGMIEQVFTYLQTNSLVTFIIFAVALFFLYKIVKLAFSIFLVTIAGVLFPFVMNLFFGWQIPITFGTVFFYATFAVVLFMLAIFIKGAGNFLKTITSPMRKASEMKKIEEEVEKNIEEKDEKEEKRFNKIMKRMKFR